MLKKTVNTAVPRPAILPRAKLAAAGFAERQWSEAAGLGLGGPFVGGGC
ncbi:MAG: hypothetical protein OXI80_03640 [Caldilineaceae bacterium]|nr:hypothetical protein [Caldilineaceae bacterium]MDE0336740.1 hypothetical protein [Caldilineaceae bacterium]